MITSDFIETHGIDPIEYLNSIDEKYQSKWKNKYEAIEFTDNELSFLKQSLKPIKIVVFSAEWCPDCYNAVPLVIKMSQVSDFLELKLFNRDDHMDVLSSYPINGVPRIPLVLFFNDKYQELGRWAERSAIAYKLTYDSKLDSAKAGTDDFRHRKANKFKDNAELLSNETKTELFNVAMKAVFLHNASLENEKILENLDGISIIQ